MAKETVDIEKIMRRLQEKRNKHRRARYDDRESRILGFYQKRLFLMKILVKGGFAKAQARVLAKAFAASYHEHSERIGC